MLFLKFAFWGARHLVKNNIKWYNDKDKGGNNG